MRCLQAGLLAGAGIELLSYQIRVCSCIAAFGRRRGGAAVGRRNVIFDASLQPGTGSGVGGKGRWTAIAVPPQTESAVRNTELAASTRVVQYYRYIRSKYCSKLKQHSPQG